jgi:hypothetical protein
MYCAVWLALSAFIYRYAFEIPIYIVLPEVDRLYRENYH